MYKKNTILISISIALLITTLIFLGLRNSSCEPFYEKEIIDNIEIQGVPLILSQKKNELILETSDKIVRIDSKEISNEDKITETIYDKDYYCTFENRIIESKDDLSTNVSVFNYDNQLEVSFDFFETLKPLNCNSNSIKALTNYPHHPNWLFEVDFKTQEVIKIGDYDGENFLNKEEFGSTKFANKEINFDPLTSKIELTQLNEVCD